VYPSATFLDKSKRSPRLLRQYLCLLHLAPGSQHSHRHLSIRISSTDRLEFEDVLVTESKRALRLSLWCRVSIGTPVEYIQMLIRYSVIAVAIARAITIPQIINLDTTYNNVKAGSWASLELSFAVVTPCLPIIKSLFTGWTRRVNEIKGRKSSTVNSSEKSFPSSWTGRSSEHRGKKMGNIVSSTNATATESGFDRDFEEKGIRIQHSLNVSSEVQ
jgi:hypothetical protein